MKISNIIKTWMYGLTIFVLIIIAGLLTGITIIPLGVLTMWADATIGYYILSAIGLFISIYFLGWVFERFMVKRKR